MKKIYFLTALILFNCHFQRATFALIGALSVLKRQLEPSGPMTLSNLGLDETFDGSVGRFKLNCIKFHEGLQEQDATRLDNTLFPSSLASVDIRHNLYEVAQVLQRKDDYFEDLQFILKLEVEGTSDLASLIIGFLGKEVNEIQLKERLKEQIVETVYFMNPATIWRWNTLKRNSCRFIRYNFNDFFTRTYEEAELTEAERTRKKFLYFFKIHYITPTGSVHYPYNSTAEKCTDSIFLIWKREEKERFYLKKLHKRYFGECDSEGAIQVSDPQVRLYLQLLGSPQDFDHARQEMIRHKIENMTQEQRRKWDSEQTDGRRDFCFDFLRRED